jgi:hypothetical protein
MEKDLEKRLKEIDLEINKLNKLRQSYAHRKKKKTFMKASKRTIKKLMQEKKELISLTREKRLLVDLPTKSVITPDQLHEIMQKFYQEISALKPIREQIKEFAQDYWEWPDIVKESKKKSSSVIIKLHETWNRYGRRFHIDVFSDKFHLVLNKQWARIFLDFIRDTRIQKETVNKT